MLNKQKMIVAGQTLALFAALSAGGISHADMQPQSKVKFEETEKGAVLGVIIGTVLAGPVGAMVGAFGGSVIGNNVETQNDLEQNKRIVTAMQGALIKAEEDLSLTLGELEKQNQHLIRNNEFARNSVACSDCEPFAYSQTALITAIESFTDSYHLNIHFESEKFALTQIYREQLKDLAGSLTRLPGVSVQLTGYTDANGAADFNQALAHKRVLSVYDQLVEAGIDPQRIVRVSMGEEQAEHNEGTTSHQGWDRRVEVSLFLPGVRS